MAVVYFTSNASTGAGSLAEAVKNASPGDVIRPDETVFERGSTIEIALASQLTISKSLTIDASPFRVRLVANGTFRALGTANNVTMEVKRFDFVGGATNVGGGVYVGVNSELVLDACLIAGCDAATAGGGLFVPSGSRAILRNSLVIGCRAPQGGGVSASGFVNLDGSTLIGNTGNNGVDFYAPLSGGLTATNSIIGRVVSQAPTAPKYVGSVVDVAPSTVGFVASPPDDLTPEDWNANAWQDWDLRLLDDASGTLSPYRDSGDVGTMSRYDLDGNFRGRETNGVATCSPGAYETIQADLFWVGEPFPQEMVDAAPQNIRVANYRQPSGLTSFEADMTWEIPDGVSYASIRGQYSGDNGVTWYGLASIAANATYRKANGITPGKEYQVRLRGVFADGSYTAWSVITYASPLELDGSDGEQNWTLQLPSALSVVNPSFQTSAGWATSRFATVFSDVAPQAGQTLFVDGVVVFSDDLPTFSESVASVVVGGFAKVDFNAANAVGLALFSVGYGSLTTAKTRLEKSYSAARVAAWARLTGQIVASTPCEFDATAYVAAGYFYNSLVSPSPTYGALIVAPSASGRVRLEGVYACDVFRTTAEGTSPTRTIKIGDAATIRARSVSFFASVEAPFETLFDKRVAIELQGAAMATVDDGAPASWADAFEIDVSDATASNLKLNSQTVYGDAPTCAVALTGSAIADRGLDVASLTMNDDATLTVDGGSVVVAELSVADGATVAFSGVDAILTATETATVGAASFAGTGYFATPAGTDASAATFAEDVRACDYGAGISAFSAVATSPTEAAIEWSATDETATLCVERKTSSGWEVVDVRGESGLTAAIATPGATVFRAFDGAAFWSDSAWFLTGEQFTVETDFFAVAEDGAESVEYETETHIVTTNIDKSIYWGQSLTFLARIRNAFTGDLLLNDGTRTKGVRYSLYRREGSLFSTSEDDVPVRLDVDAGAACLLETAQTSDAWPGVEYNFALIPANSADEPLIPAPGNYVLRVFVELTTGNPIVFVYTFAAR